MITTVTANPSLDRTLHVASITHGAVNRATSEHVEPSGKGVNVAVALHAGHRPATAVLPVGGAAGTQLRELLGRMRVAVRTVPMRGDVRSNVSVIEFDGTTTKFNAPGARLDAGEVAALVAAADDASDVGQWLAWCGSLPAGFSDAALARAIAGGRAAGRLIALDSSGSALSGVLAGAADALPHLIKPNAEELAELVGRPLPTVGTVADAARELVAIGVHTVLVSLGGDGAILVEAATALYGCTPALRVVNTAGAGDAFLAGYLASTSVPGRRAADHLTSALRYGAAAVAQPGTLLMDPPTDDDAVHADACPVTDLDVVRDRPIS